MELNAKAESETTQLASDVIVLIDLQLALVGGGIGNCELG